MPSQLRVDQISTTSGTLLMSSDANNNPSFNRDIALNGVNAVRFSATDYNVTGSTNTSTNHYGGQWPQKHLGRFQLRGYTAGGQPGGQYLHIKTNIPCTSYMTFWRAEGYLYGNGNIFARGGAYPYNGTVINTFINNSGNSLFDAFYASSEGGGGNNRLCLRFNRQSTGYSEGRFDLWISGHSAGEYDFSVIGFVYTDSASNQF